MKENIFLIGFMGSGKSTIAKVLEERLHMELVEMDARIVEEQKMSINEIFERYGETYFRDVESKLVLNIKDTGNCVVSCGGGVILRKENVENMKENGSIIYLCATPQTIYERVKDSTDRPLLNGNMNVEYISQMMEKRRPLYEAAADISVSVDEKSIAAICDEIVKIVNR